jgi:hypothetical protein
MPDKFINLNPGIYFLVYKLSSTEPTNIYEKELGTEFTNLLRKELIKYAKKRMKNIKKNYKRHIINCPKYVQRH